MTDPRPDELPAAGAGQTPEVPAAASPPVPPPRSRTERREQAVTDALRTLIRDLHVDQFGVAPERLDTVALTLRAHVSPGQNWALEFDPPLAAQVSRQLEEAQAAQAVFRPGRVWCFRCESADCGHGVPPSAVAVFKAYGPTGQPEWHDLHQAFIAAQDERVDRLFGDAAATVALVQSGREVRQDQLTSFGRASKTYSILGQVVAGYFQLPRRAAGGDEKRRLAVTFQAVETRGRRGRLEVRLNTIAGVPEGVDLDELFASEWEPSALRARELAARALAALSERADSARLSGRAEDLQAAMRRVPAVMRQLAAFLERGHRQDRRRTRHVEDRRQHDRRPVHKALEDARSASPEAVYADERSGTWVVCGPQGRSHVFSAVGRHVTSFVLGPGALELRLRTQRWRRATAEEARNLKERLSEATAHSAELPDGRAGEAGALRST